MHLGSPVSFPGIIICEACFLKFDRGQAFALLIPDEDNHEGLFLTSFRHNNIYRPAKFLQRM